MDELANQQIQQNLEEHLNIQNEQLNAPNEQMMEHAPLQAQQININHVDMIRDNYSTVTFRHGQQADAKMELKKINHSLHEVMLDKFPQQNIYHPAPNYVRIHENRARYIANEYADDYKPAEIIKVSMGGTGFTGWRRQNKGMKLKDGSEYEGVLETADGRRMQKTKKGYTITDENGDQHLVKKASINVFTKALSWLKCKIFDKDMTNYHKKLESVANYKAAKQLYKDSIEQKKDKLYGPTQSIGDKTYKHIRSKQFAYENGVTVEKTTMAGSLGILNTNSGEYKMQKTVEYLQTFYQPRIKNWMDKYGNYSKEPSKEVIPQLHFLMQGHSRGAVSTSVATGKLLHYAREYAKRFANSQELLDALHFENVLLDPVYGLGSGFGSYGEMNLKIPTKAMKKEGVDAYGASCPTTVMYSIHSDHFAGFAPQAIKGADRVILTPFAHTQGLGDVTNVTRQDGTQEQKAQLLTDYVTGDVYKTESLNELGAGLYIMDENRQLIKMPDADTATKAVKHILQQTATINFQLERHHTIYSVINDFYKNHPVQQQGNNPAPQAN